MFTALGRLTRCATRPSRQPEDQGGGDVSNNNDTATASEGDYQNNCCSGRAAQPRAMLSRLRTTSEYTGGPAGSHGRLSTLAVDSAGRRSAGVHSSVLRTQIPMASWRKRGLADRCRSTEWQPKSYRRTRLEDESRGRGEGD